jgi:hypothetical protein
MRTLIVVSSVLEMARLLEKPSEAWDMAWAAEVCRSSRNVHIAVWRDGLQKTYVAQVVVELLYRASNLLWAYRASERVDIDGVKLDGYILNVIKRLSNIRNYLEDCPPCFPPDDLLTPVSQEMQRRIYETKGMLSWVPEVMVSAETCHGMPSAGSNSTAP